MKQLFTFLLCLLSFVVQSQEVEKDPAKRDPNKYYLKDGLEIGNKADIIKACAEGAKTSAQAEGIEDVQAMCECVFEVITENLTMVDMLQIIVEEEPDYSKAIAMLPPDAKVQLMQCYMSNNTLFGNSAENMTAKKQNDDSSSNMLTSFREEYMTSCIGAMKKEIAEGNLEISEEAGVSYCNCTFEKIIEKNLSFSDLSQLEDQNSIVFNEVIVPCATLFLVGDNSLASGDDNETELPIKSTITGPKEENIPIMMVGKVGRVKLKIGDKERYFLIDSGASSVMIDSKLERQLLLDEFIYSEDYLSDRTYTLADGTSVTCHRFILPELQLGNYVVNDVEVAVVENAKTDLLLGQSFLNQFSRWSINNKTNELHLEK